MEYLGVHNDRKVYWWEYSEKNLDKLPDSNWICFVIEDGLPQSDLFEKFVRTSIHKGLLEFKAYGKLSSKLDDSFDETMVLMETIEGHLEIDITTTWHNKEGLASAFWQCFHATCLSETTDSNNLKIICVHFDNTNRKQELKNYIERFNEGWLPSEED
jgi:hypothetical protein